MCSQLLDNRCFFIILCNNRDANRVMRNTDAQITLQCAMTPAHDRLADFGPCQSEANIFNTPAKKYVQPLCRFMNGG